MKSGGFIYPIESIIFRDLKTIRKYPIWNLFILHTGKTIAQEIDIISVSGSEHALCSFKVTTHLSDTRWLYISLAVNWIYLPN